MNYESRRNALPTCGSAPIEPPRPTPEVIREMNRTTELTEAIHGGISLLEARLAGVTRNSLPEGSNDKGPLSLQPVTPVAQTLAAANDNLVAANRRLHDLIDRLEV